MTTWKNKIESWLEGKYQIYPSDIKESFYYETTPITNNMNTNYEENYIQNSYLTNMKQDYSSFEKEINKSNNKYVVSFFNLSKTSYLIVPIPRSNKKFTTLKDFIDNASKIQQKKLWQKVALSTIMMLKKYNKVWISTHGTGVPYLHIRIDIKPKYYQTIIFKNF